MLSLTISVAQHCNRQLYFFNYSDGSSGNYHIGFADYGVVQILSYLEIVSAWASHDGYTLGSASPGWISGWFQRWRRLIQQYWRIHTVYDCHQSNYSRTTKSTGGTKLKHHWFFWNWRW